MILRTVDVCFQPSSSSRNAAEDSCAGEAKPHQALLIDYKLGLLFVTSHAFRFQLFNSVLVPFLAQNTVYLGVFALHAEQHLANLALLPAKLVFLAAPAFARQGVHYSSKGVSLEAPVPISSSDVLQHLALLEGTGKLFVAQLTNIEIAQPILVHAQTDNGRRHTAHIAQTALVADFSIFVRMPQRTASLGTERRPTANTILDFAFGAVGFDDFPLSTPSAN